MDYIISLREYLQETPICYGKIHGLWLGFFQEKQSIENNTYFDSLRYMAMGHI